jgi:hypothetical protein
MTRSGIRRVLPFVSVLVFLGLLYDGWIFYSRWSERRQIEEKHTEKEAQDARDTLNRIGGTDLKILSFSAAPPVVRRAGKARICYSIVNAKTVRVDPPIGDVYPALSRCLDISPRKTTEYQLTAQDDAGHTVTESLVVQVKP